MKISEQLLENSTLLAIRIGRMGLKLPESAGGESELVSKCLRWGERIENRFSEAFAAEEADWYEVTEKCIDKLVEAGHLVHNH